MSSFLRGSTKAPDRTKRRTILLAGWVAFVGVALPALSQKARIRRIVIFQPGTEEATRMVIGTFRATLKELGYVEGQDIVIEIEWGAGRTERFNAIAPEVVARKPDVIVTSTSAAVAAFKSATSTIPIVFATAGHPVEQGFVASLGRPGGNITGVTVYVEMSGKIVEVVREAFPRAQRLAMLVHTPDPAHKLLLPPFHASSSRYEFEPIIVGYARPVEFDRVFRELAERKADAVYLADLAFNYANHEELIERALQARIALVSNFHDATAKGGLLSYGAPREDNYRRAAMLVDKILKGARPGDLPVEQPERFQLVVNRRTARAIGVELAPVALLRAQRIID